MKTLLLILTLLVSGYSLCLYSQDTLKAASDSSSLGEADLLGTWSIFQITYITREGVKKMTETQMKSQNAFADYFFMPSGKFQQISNMTQTGETLTQPGTWKLNSQNLIIKIRIDNEMKELSWDVDYKYGVLNLSRSSADSALKIINSFRKKQ